MKRRERLSAALALLIVSATVVLVRMHMGKHPAEPVLAANGLVCDCPASGNPAAVYCVDVMGYEHRVIETPEGGQSGVCIMPSGEACSQWDFYAGLCGQRYSYCARRGYGTETRWNGRDPFSPQYAVCVSQDGRSRGSVAQLSGLSANMGTSISLLDIGLLGDMPSDNGLPVTHDTLPPSFDWRDYQGQNWLTPIKDQGNCGACWAFAAVGMTEAYHNITASDPDLDLDLAEQQPISCWGYGDCGGGTMAVALGIQQAGIVDEDCVPYTASNSSCTMCSDWQSRLTYIDELTISFLGDRQAIRQTLIDYGPIYAAMGIGPDQGGYFDDQGVYRCADYHGIDHLVVIVGYDDAGGYWIVRNSWGAEWNGDGYLHLGYGECGMESDLSTYAYNIPPTGQIISPIDGEIVSTSPLTIEVEASDGGSGVDRVEFYAEYDGSWHHLGSDADSPYTLAWDCSSVGDQVVRLATNVVDVVGNETVDAGGYVTVTFDTSPIQIITPTAGAFLSEDSIYIEADVFGDPDVDRVEFSAWYDGAWHFIESDNDGSDGYYVTWDVSGLADRSGLRLEARNVDPGGNQGATAVDNLTLDRVSPTGSVSINDGTPYVTSTVVTLNLMAEDEVSGVEQVAISSTTDFSNTLWIDYVGSLSWTLPAGDGSKRVYVRFRDRAGNASPVYSDTVILDTVVPTGTILIQGGAEVVSGAQVTLTLSASDTNGVSQMRLRNDTAAWGSWEPFTTTRSWMLPSQPGPHTVWVAFQDPAGNVSVAYSDSIIRLHHVHLPLVMHGFGP